ncbi:MAG: transketolase [Acidimicrobiia bacterium]|nr:transketolase [Acidimicrobiia bacterium]
MTDLDAKTIATIRGLAMDGPHAARSGHQGTAMSLAPVAHVLWSRIMNFDAEHPDWFDRDRFILSPGHASILQYALLHLYGFGLTLEDLRDFRQWGSATPGHPEVGHTAGVEVTTGPLGQGLANAVGMAIAEENLRARLGAEVCDHKIFGLCSDGDLQEGVSHEAASLAGHLGLGRINFIYDDNDISIDGPTSLSFSDDSASRFRAYGWHVQEVGAIGEDLDALEAAIRAAVAVEDQPSLIVLKTTIAFPATESVGTSHAHGYAIFDEEIAATKAAMDMPADETFHVPDDVLEHCRAAGIRGASAREAWNTRIADYSGDRAQLDALLHTRPLDGWQDALPEWEPGESVATRKASNAVLQALASKMPSLAGGGADLTGNTGTVIKDMGVFDTSDRAGRQIYFGIREHAMGSAMVGMAAHGGLFPVGGTFLVFSDYMRGAVRLAALSHLPMVFSWTHDSVGVGEDGPTHQPVEHVAALRAMPELSVWRPADANETAAAWAAAVEATGPTAMILSRQNLPVLAGTENHEDVARGGYVLQDSDSAPSVVLVGAGSEVQHCVSAASTLRADGIQARVVSLPCWEVFEAQSEQYRASVLPDGIPAVSIEAGSTMGWSRYADVNLGIDRFGASAPGDLVMEKLGMTGDAVADAARSVV